MNSVFPMNRKSGLCEICNEPHPIQNKCGYDAMVRRITKLLEANRLIPSILEANKELTDLANMFKTMANDSAKALAIAEKAAMEFDNGTQVWKRFQEKLEEAWQARETLNQGTATQENLNQESIILNEKGNKISTVGTPSGEIIAPDSLR